MSSQIVAELRAKILQLEQGVVDRQHAILPTADKQLAEFLPDHGLRMGTFVELIQSCPGAHAVTFALLLARNIIELRPRWAVFDSNHSFNPATVCCADWNTENLTLIRSDASHAAWAFAQLLKSREIGLSLCFLPNLDNMVFRRFQLSAERGEGLGIAIRPADALKRPCWSSLRLLIEPGNSNCVRVSVVHTRGVPTTAESIEVSL